MLIALTGLPGVGKSTFAEALGRSIGVPVLSVDPIEAAMLRARIDPSQPTGLAAYFVVEALVERQLGLGLSVIVDAANYVEPARQAWRVLSGRLGAPLRWIEIICSDESIHHKRVEARGVYIEGFHRVSWNDVLRRKTETEPWNDQRLTLDSAGDSVASNVTRAIEYIGSRT
jgi:predicted kinase